MSHTQDYSPEYAGQRSRSFNDKVLTCAEADCGEEFLFSAQEQQWYAEHGLRNTPKRCKDCRQRRRDARE